MEIGSKSCVISIMNSWLIAFCCRYGTGLWEFYVAMINSLDASPNSCSAPSGTSRRQALAVCSRCDAHNRATAGANCPSNGRTVYSTDFELA